MLPQDMGGVVDAKLRVYGVGRLRVVDASVFLIEWSAHMMAPTYGLAEKAAEVIAADYSAGSSSSSDSGSGNTNNGGSKGAGVQVALCPVLSISVVLLCAILVTF